MDKGVFENKTEKVPLAFRMAPENLDEIVGQEEILGKGKLLRRMIEADRLRSVILFGPPGCGKTSIARVIANHSKIKMLKINAVTSGVKDLRAVIEDAENPIITPEGRLLLFIDEIHRFNKAQQDLLLPCVESGSIILIGATTENPFFEVNKALISRSSVFMLKALEASDIYTILQRALKDKIKGIGHMNISIAEDTLVKLSNISGGDARIALNALELAALSTEPESDGKIVINLETLSQCVSKRSLAYDKNGEAHYDTISAFIKSMRGSDPDATVYYLARLLHSGEDIEFIARRIIICAAEDIGLANPQALSVAVSAYEAVKMTGMPEARIILSEAALMLALSPKSNSAYKAVDEALNCVNDEITGEIPFHLRNAVTGGLAELGYGKGYLYPHDFEGNFVKQQYLPDKIKDRNFYKPYSNGYEKKIKDWLKKNEGKE